MGENIASMRRPDFNNGQWSSLGQQASCFPDIFSIFPVFLAYRFKDMGENIASMRRPDFHK